MAPGRNSYRVRVPLFDARQRRLQAEKRWPRTIGFVISLSISLALWAMIIWVTMLFWKVMS